eukprot:1225766-Rhodomonas_salina.1
MAGTLGSMRSTSGPRSATPSPTPRRDSDAHAHMCMGAHTHHCGTYDTQTHVTFLSLPPSLPP